jgi:F0F1-type ATP synthase assembly protein I
MSGDPEAPLSESSRAGHPRQNVPAASPPALPSAEERRERSAAVKFAGVGLQFALTLLVGLGLGHWADKKFGTSIFVYFGVFLGAGAAFYSMYRQLMANLERDEQAKRAQRGSAGESPRRERGGPGGSP